ncbi:MAG: methionine aminotransferase [Spirochaetes bacterium]|nr:methionine aminotransferase [Spirochaetota bacterium]
MEITSKLPDVGITIFTVMTRLANEHGAINLSQGFPDFDIHPEIIALVEKQMRAGRNQYAPMQGALELRERIAEKVLDLYGARYDPLSEITVTAGATEALFAAIAAVVRTGDEVIIFEPAYDSYVPSIALSGGVPVPLAMRFPGYSIDWNLVKDSVTEKTRMMILNSPHNPSGAVLSRDDIAALTDIVRGTDIVILSDEVYEHIIFDGRRHEGMARHPELAARSFAVSSFGKTYHATGWKVGYCVAPRALSAEFQKVHQYLTFAVNTPVQLALAEFMARREEYLGVPAFYQAKRDLFLELVRDSRFRAVPSAGTYFQMLDYSTITDEPDTDFAVRLTREHGVAAIPPSVFYNGKDDNRVLRFCFAKRDETLKKAAERLCAI